MRNQVQPFLLRPTGKDYLWGGTRLRDEYGKETGCNPLAETWECSTHPNGESFVASGEYEGMSLAKLISLRPEIVGIHPKVINGQLPILIKFIDAKQDLSVQVHPDNEYAHEYENGQSGKTEMWYVIDAEKDTSLIYGLSRDTDKASLQKAIENKTILRYLQQVSVRKDDLFFIPSGTIHAIGAGALIAEIQQNSNLTYRLYDYDRRDKNGNRRELHVRKALDVADMRSAAEPRQPLRLLKYRPGCASELLCRCEYFQVERLLINTDNASTAVEYFTDEDSFKVLLCLEGNGTLSKDNFKINFHKGDCIFIPAATTNLQLQGQSQLLSVNA